MTSSFKSVTVRCPATTANMGPGFDCLGMALDLWNELQVSHADEFNMQINGEGATTLPRDDSNLVVVGVKAAFAAAKKPVPTLAYRLDNKVPPSRGLGSSSAAIVSGLIAGLVLAGHELAVEGSEELLQLAATIEGHPDNVAPAIYGGIQLGIKTDARWWTRRVSIPAGLQCVLFIPDATCETADARRVVPTTFAREDVIFNASRTALLVHALATSSLDDLLLATQDRMHQPHRAALMPFLYPLIEAATDAGAHAAFLSGAGTTVMALTSGRKGDIMAQRSAERKERDVSRAMHNAAAGLGESGRIVITQPSELGAHVVRTDPPTEWHVVAVRRPSDDGANTATSQPSAGLGGRDATSSKMS